jgi:hypothetical protein
MDFGYYISQVMRFYSMSYENVIKLPIYTFWELSRNIERLRADENSHDLKILCSAISSAFGGKVEKTFEELHKRKGEIVKQKEETGSVHSNIALLKLKMGLKG